MTVDVLADLQALYGAIIARTTGKQVQSAGHKDKTAAFAQTSTSEMIKLYRQLWYDGCGLPPLKELDDHAARRGPPARVYG